MPGYFTASYTYGWRHEPPRCCAPIILYKPTRYFADVAAGLDAYFRRIYLRLALIAFSLNYYEAGSLPRPERAPGAQVLLFSFSRFISSRCAISAADAART